MKSISFQSTSRDSSAQFSAPAAEVERLTPSNGALSSNIGSTTVGAPQKRRPSKPTGLEKWLLRQLLAAIGNPPVVAVLWSGEEVTGGADGTTPAPEAIRFRVSDRGTLWKILVDPFFQFPEAYCDGRLTFDGDLETLTGLIAESAALSPQGTRLLTYAAKLLHWGGRNTLAGSQKHIQHHYDIGNDFYRLWLDESLLYTCAYFEQPTATLEQRNCEDGPRLPQTRTPPGRDGDRSGLRLGRFCAPHGETLWRSRAGLQHLARAGRRGAPPRKGRGVRRPSRVHSR